MLQLLSSWSMADATALMAAAPEVIAEERNSGPRSAGRLLQRGTAVAASTTPVYPATKNPDSPPRTASPFAHRSPNLNGTFPAAYRSIIQELETGRQRRDDPERRQSPGADRHRRGDPERAQHVEEPSWPTEIENEQNRARQQRQRTRRT